MGVDALIPLISNEIGLRTVIFSFFIGFMLLYTAYNRDNWKELKDTDKTFFSLTTGWTIYWMLFLTTYAIMLALATLFQTSLSILGVIYSVGFFIFLILILANLHIKSDKIESLHTLASSLLFCLAIVWLVLFGIYLGILKSPFSELMQDSIFKALFGLSLFIFSWTILMHFSFKKISYENKKKTWKIPFTFNKKNVLVITLSVMFIAVISNLFLFPKTNLIEHKNNEYELNRYISHSNFDFIAKTQEDFQIKRTGYLGWFSLYYGDYFDSNTQLKTLVFKEGYEQLASITFNEEDSPYGYYNDPKKIGIKNYFVDNKSKNIILKFNKEELQKHNLTKIELYGDRKINITSSNFSISRKYLGCDSNSVCKVQLNISNNLTRLVRADNEQIFSFDEFRSDLLKCIISNISVDTFHNEEKKVYELVLCKSDTKICEVENSFYFSTYVKNPNSNFMLDNMQINENTSVVMDIYAKC